MKNGWTGGQYSLYRIALSAYLFVHFAALIPWGKELFSREGALEPASASPLFNLFPNVLHLSDAPGFVRTLLLVGVAATVPLALGAYDRAAALVLWYLWACLLGRNPLISNPGLPFIGWLLLAHVLVPRGPYGSWVATDRPDPRSGWSMPAPLFRAAWILMALGYLYSGATKLISPSWLDGTALFHVLENPLARPGLLRELLLELPAVILKAATWSALALELLFAPIAIFRRLRAWMWISMVAMHIGLLVLIDFADLTFGVLLLHFFTFDPGWIRPPAHGAIQRVFYDGDCGLCHRAVRFVIAEYASLVGIRFAPLQGESFRMQFPEPTRSSLPDSLVVLTADGRTLTRSDAVLGLLAAAGGLWRLLAGIARLLPSRALDAAYDGIGRSRHAIFGRPSGACPVAPGSIRGLFDLE